jgi:hypothetical protein
MDLRDPRQGLIPVPDFRTAASHRDGSTSEERAQRLRFLIDRYPHPEHVYCFKCGEPDKLRKMYMCQTCGAAYCWVCAGSFEQVVNVDYGRGRICPECQELNVLGIAS